MSAVEQETTPELTLGWRLRMAMESAGMTALDMAADLEIDRTTVGRWIHDETTPKRIYIRAWAERCNVSVAWLMDEPPPKVAGRRRTTDNKTYAEQGRKPPRKGRDTHSYREYHWPRLNRKRLDLAALTVLDHSQWVAPLPTR